MQRNSALPASTEAIFLNWIENFRSTVEHGRGSAFADLFVEDGFWKDILSFTWEHRTFAGRKEISEAFDATKAASTFRSIKLARDRAAPVAIRRSGREVIEGYLEFETAVGKGVGFVRLQTGPGDEAALWMLLTTLNTLTGHEEMIGANRPSGDEFSQISSPVNWSQIREAERRFEDREPQVVIVGAGQGGLMLGARLRQMGVDALIIERRDRVGDVWRQRYENLTLHNELAANHFPYMKFPETWPRWLPKDMLGMWLETYAEFMELNVWVASELVQSTYDELANEWRISVRQKDGSTRALRPKHLVIASGVSGGAPKLPHIPGLSDFGGEVMHSSEFVSGKDWAGKKAIVFGTGNSGHDVVQDLYVSGASVTLVQRGPTCVVSLDPSARISYSIFNEGRSVEDTDLMTAAIPYPVLKSTYQWVTKLTNENDRELHEKLHAVGFKTTNGKDDTGFQFLYLRGAGGYYIDVGCCDLLIDRKVPLLDAENSEGLVAGGLKLKNGEVVPADLVVLATGFYGIEHSLRNMLGDTIADKIGAIWGFDEDGVMRNMWRRTAQDGLWLMGGAIIEARLYSRFLALEILASLKGVLPERSELPLVPRRTPVVD